MQDAVSVSEDGTKSKLNDKQSFLMVVHVDAQSAVHDPDHQSSEVEFIRKLGQYSI